MKYMHDPVEDVTHILGLRCVDPSGQDKAEIALELTRDDYRKIAEAREWLTPRYPRIGFVGIWLHGGKLTTPKGVEENFYPCLAQVYPGDFVLQGWSNGRLYFSESVHV